MDNSSTDDTLTIAAELFQATFSMPNNGLAVSNNAGARKGKAKYILFANPDVTPKVESLALFADHLDHFGGLVAPRLVGADGALQENARGWPCLAAQAANRLGWPHGLRHRYRWPLSPGRTGSVPWLMGAAIATVRRDFARLGPWPEEYFLYCEDIEWCMRANDHNLSVQLIGSEEWTHYWGKASRGALISRARWLHTKSAIRFFMNRPRLLFSIPEAPAQRHPAVDCIDHPSQ